MVSLGHRGGHAEVVATYKAYHHPPSSPGEPMSNIFKLLESTHRNMTPLFPAKVYDADAI
jgi:hypothetical protein